MAETTEIPGWDLDVGFAATLEQAYEDLQDSLSAILHGEDEEGVTPSGAPYCGCMTCEARETLYVLVPLIAAGIASGEIRKADDSVREEHAS